MLNNNSIFKNIAHIERFNLNNSIYPGATLFVKGCNFSCWFCHNKDLLKKQCLTLNPKYVIKTIDKLKEYQKIMNNMSITLCGGEPTIYPDVKDLILYLKQNDFFVKLDTNGFLVDRIVEVIDILDIVAVDIKYPPEKYKTAKGINVDGSYLFKIFDLAKKYEGKFIFRTTLVPDLNQSDIDKIQNIVKQHKIKHKFQKYVNYQGT